MLPNSSHFSNIFSKKIRRGLTLNLERIKGILYIIFHVLIVRCRSVGMQVK